MIGKHSCKIWQPNVLAHANAYFNFKFSKQNNKIDL